MEQLKVAIFKVFNWDTYLSPQAENALSRKTSPVIEVYDIFLMEQLANGSSQKEISDRFRLREIQPSSLSSVEKKVGSSASTLKQKMQSIW